jgi:hypothetical protein
MMAPLSMIVREVEGAARAVRWRNKAVMKGFVKRGWGAITLIKGFIVIVDLYPLGPKLGDVLAESGPTAYVGHDILECSTVACIRIWTRGTRGNRLTLSLERRLGGNVNTEVFLDNVAFPLDIGDRDETTQIGLLSDPPLCLTRDDDVNAMRTRLGWVLLSNPVAWVKETGAGGA